MKRLLVAITTCCCCLIAGFARADEYPAPADLPAIRELPDALVMLHGAKVTSKEDWFAKRRPELKKLFEHYMYGAAPPAPDDIEFSVERVNKDYFGGKATKKEVTIRFGPEGTPPIHLLLVTPNSDQPSPVVLGLNFCGNHTLLDDPSIALPKVWMPARCPGCEGNKATDAGRGKKGDNFPFEYAVSRGYALATFYHGDVDPDRHDWTDGVHVHYLPKGQKEPGPHAWGAIAAWAWGLSRAVDYLVQDSAIDKQRIVVYGHSRNGKTALLAGAFDERFAAVIPHQAGCGGTSPARGKIGEQLRDINKNFPHWFNDTYVQFNDQPERLPFDQHALIAMCAPRPVLLTNAEEDQWANPAGQFENLKAADRVYRFLGAEGLAAEEMPPLGKPVLSHLGYFIRAGKHSVTDEDWKVFLDFADAQLAK
jgi:hypothetical protein